MKVVSVPNGLKAVVAALALCGPLAALELVLMKQAPWWKVPYERIAWSCVPVAALYLCLSGFVLRAKRVSMHLLSLVFAGWLGFTVATAIRLHSTTLAFFALLLAAVGLGFLAWIRFELGRSFLDPKIRWYEGLPKAIHGLDCEIVSDRARVPFRVTRLDREGVFVFRDNSRSEAGSNRARLVSKAPLELHLSFRDREVRCVGAPILVFHRMGAESGIGLQFRGMTPDGRKTLGDFVEALKGEGYVS